MVMAMAMAMVMAMVLAMVLAAAMATAMAVRSGTFPFREIKTVGNFPFRRKIITVGKSPLIVGE